MKWKRLLLSLVWMWGLVPATGVIAIDISDPSPVYAATQEQQREAERKCRNERFKESCKRGYLGAVEEPQKTRGTACRNLTGESLTACRNAYNAAAPAGTPDADDDCPDGAVKVSPAFGIEGNCIGSNDQNPIFAFLSVAISFITALFGMVLVFVIIISGFQYILGAADSDNVKGAKDRLKAAATGLVLFILMFAVIQLILPPDASIFR